MATIVTRSGKGSPLTNNEVDANFTNLNTDKAELSGATFTGEITANGGIALGDNDKATFGASDDLQIYHNGSGSFVDDVGTGNMFVRGNNLALKNADGSKSYFFGTNGGAANLYYDGVSKLSTTSTGIDVTGTATMDGLTVDGTGYAYLGNTAAYRGELNYDSSGNTSLTIANSWNNDNSEINFKVKTAGTGKKALQIKGSGDISFYEDTGTTPKLFWDASAESLTVGASSGNTNVLRVVQSVDGTNSRGLSVEATTGHELSVYRDANSDGAAHLRNNGINTIALKGGNVGIGTSSPARELSIGDGTGSPNIQLLAAASGNSRIEFGDTDDSDAGEIQYVHSSNYMQFTTNSAERLRIDSSGRVGIGTISPSVALQVESSTAQSGRSLRLAYDGSYYTEIAGKASGGVSYNAVNATAGGHRFEIDGSEKMRLDYAGRVGIGTSSPERPLHIASATPYIVFEETDAAQKFSMGSGGGKFFLYDETDSAQRLTIDSSGNVGIGTSSPSYGLDLQNANGGILARFKDSDSSHNGIVIAGDVNSGWVGNSPSVTGEGIYYQNSLNAMRLYTNGSERLRIDSAGRVGIGTSSPDASTKVNIKQSAVSDINGLNGIRLDHSTGTAYSGFGLHNTDAVLTAGDAGGTANTNLLFRTASSGSEAERMRIDSSGKVGIGTSSPAKTLSVAGNLQVDSGAANSDVSFVADDGYDVYLGFGTAADRYASHIRKDLGPTKQLTISAETTLALKTNSAERLRIDSSGNVGIGTSSPDTLLEVVGADPILTIRDTETSGASSNATLRLAESGASDTLNNYWDINHTGGSALRFVSKIGATTAERARIDSSGNVGIGTSSPNRVLHVEGTATTFGSTRSVLQIADDTAMAAGVGGGLTFTGKATTGQGDANTAFAAIHGLKENGTSTNTAGAMLFSTRTSGFTPAERMRIDSSGNVGIGTSSPATKLAVSGGYISQTDGTVSTYLGSDGSGSLFGTTTNHYLRFITNNTERARIDSSGNLLVGTTSTANNTDGIRLLNAGYISIAQDSNNVPCGFFNKITHDGNILEFQKDGTSVGSIGTVFGSLTAGTGATGLRFTDGDTSIRPWNLTTNAVIDNTINLGAPAGGFKDLYLSGGVYLGGTGAANKLDDYEEGTFTATLKGSSEPASLVTSTSYYTKVGNKVHFEIGFENADTTGYSGDFFVTGLPFASTGPRAVASVIHYKTTTWSDGHVPVAVIGSGQTQVDCLNQLSGSPWAVNQHSAGTGRYFWITGTYITTS